MLFVFFSSLFSEHIDRLVAARLSADILGASTVLVARTDAEAATLLDSNIDSRDHPFILGVTVPGLPSLAEVIDEARKGGKDVESASTEWTSNANLMTFGDAVLLKIRSLPDSYSSKKEHMKKLWLASNPHTLSITKARAVADKIFGQKDSIFFDWEQCRVREGYYRIKPGIDYCIQRARAYAPYADLIWMETAVPSIEDAREFSLGVRVSLELNHFNRLDSISFTSYKVINLIVFLTATYRVSSRTKCLLTIFRQASIGTRLV
jgi:isocitrate lyase